MGNWFSSDNNTNGNVDVSTLNLTDTEKDLFKNMFGAQLGGAKERDEENHYLKYDIFKILAEMEESDNGMRGGGRTDTVTDHQSLIDKIKASYEKSKQMKGGASKNCAELGGCGCNEGQKGGADLSEVKKVRELVENELRGGKKKSKKHKKNSTSSSISSPSSTSSTSLSTTSTSTSTSDSKTPMTRSVGGDSDNAGISVFPFNSTTNSSISSKNFRMLRRRI